MGKTEYIQPDTDLSHLLTEFGKESIKLGYVPLYSHRKRYVERLKSLIAQARIDELDRLTNYGKMGYDDMVDSGTIYARITELQTQIKEGK